MSAPHGTSGAVVWRTDPEAMADEVLSICRGVCRLLAAPDQFIRYRPIPRFFSLPQFPEIAAAANVSLDGMGRNVDGIDMVQAEVMALSLPRRAEPTRTDMGPPTSDHDLGALLDEITARLDAVAWELEALKRLGAWCDENPEKGAQVCTALRLIAQWTTSDIYEGRD